MKPPNDDGITGVNLQILYYGVRYTATVASLLLVVIYGTLYQMHASEIKEGFFSSSIEFRVGMFEFRVKKFTIIYAIYGPEKLPVDVR